MIRRAFRQFLSPFLLLTTLIAALPLEQATAAKKAHPKTEKRHVSYAYQSNIWKVIGDDLNLDIYQHNHYVQQQIRWFLAHPKSLQKRTQNAKPYIYYVTQEVKRRGMPLELALLPMIESNYNPCQLSSAQAAGLWQLIPSTAQGLGVLINWWYDGRRDIITSTHVALDYLQYLHDYFDSWPLAFAAYNAGIGTVNRAIHWNKRHGRRTDYWALHLPKQTHDYVPKLLAIAIILAHPERFHIPVQKVLNKPYFTRVTVNFPITLHQIARLAHTTASRIRQLNPGFLRAKPAPKKFYNLLIPTQKLTRFKTSLAHYLKQTTEKQRNQGVYTVRIGDSLSEIAAAYGTSVTKLQKANHLETARIRVGQNLYVPE